MSATKASTEITNYKGFPIIQVEGEITKDRQEYFDTILNLSASARVIIMDLSQVTHFNRTTAKWLMTWRNSFSGILLLVSSDRLVNRALESIGLLSPSTMFLNQSKAFQAIDQVLKDRETGN